MSDGLSASMDTSKIFARLNRLEKKVQHAVIPAAQAGAQVFYDETRARVPVSDFAHYFYGQYSKRTGQRYYFEPGNLRNSIYQYRLRYTDDGGRATYAIAWNHRTAPYGYMVENGTSNAPAHPFLRPAYHAAKGRAQQATSAVLKAAAKEALA
ncbi:MAG: hypothetical protein EOO32_00165 [Comamonadaceae bacterium]|nr:MAG: hypothetical protein EOO32_00165 [Comamonadaceae bacterium]